MKPQVNTPDESPAPAGMTQQAIGDQFGITQAVVSSILRNPASEYYRE